MELFSVDRIASVNQRIRVLQKELRDYEFEKKSHPVLICVGIFFGLLELCQSLKTISIQTQLVEK